MHRRIFWLGLITAGICQVLPGAERTLAVAVSQTVQLRPEIAVLQVSLSTTIFRSPDEVGTKLGTVLPDITLTGLTSGLDCEGNNRVIDTYTFAVKTPFSQLSAALQRLEAARTDLTANFGLIGFSYQVLGVTASQAQFAAQEGIVRPALEAAARVEAQTLAQAAGLALGPAVSHLDSALVNSYYGIFGNPGGDFNVCATYASGSLASAILSGPLSPTSGLSGLTAQYDLSVKYQVN